MATASAGWRIERIGVGDGMMLRALNVMAAMDVPERWPLTLAHIRSRPVSDFEDDAMRQAAARTETTFFLQVNRNPMGMIRAAVSPETARRGMLSHLWVAPEHRNDGAAKALIRTAAHWIFDSAGVHEIGGWASPDGIAPLKCWERMGFRAGSLVAPVPVATHPADLWFSATRYALRQAPA